MKPFSRLRHLIGLFLGFHLAASIGSAQPSSALPDSAQRFAQGVESFRAGKLEEAKKSFLALEAESPNHSDLLFNLGLIALKENRPGAAIGIWRKGLADDPSNESLYQAMIFAQSKLDKKDVPREFGAWERYRETVLWRISPTLAVPISAALLLVAGWLWLRWLGKRKRAFEEETASPPAPVAAIVISLLFFFVIGVIGSIFVDRTDLRGTVIASKISVLSAPELEATALFDLFEGLEVIVRETREVSGKSWRRITYPGGLSGWVPSAVIFATSDSVDRAFETTSSKVNP